MTIVAEISVIESFSTLKKILCSIKKIFNHKKKKNLKNLFLNRAIISRSKHSFAEKMKTLVLAAILCLMGSMDCCGRQKKGDGLTSEVGLDLGAIISSGEIRFNAGRQFSGHWSLEGTHTLRLSMLVKGRNTDEEVHYSEFEDIGTSAQTEPDDLMTGGLKVKYWISETYKGGFIMAGCRLGDKRGIDGTVGLGYSIRIWQGWRCTLSCEMDIRRSHIQQRLVGDGLGFTISYTY